MKGYSPEVVASLCNKVGHPRKILKTAVWSEVKNGPNFLVAMLVKEKCGENA